MPFTNIPRAKTRRPVQYAVAVNDGSGWTVILADATSRKQAAQEALVDWPFEANRVHVARAVTVMQDDVPTRGHPFLGAAAY